jgi:predicted enzyme related to lactoylglutathione lyase
MTTDVAAAKAFYGDVVGWETQDASTPDLAYCFFTSERVSVSGLIELPQEARKMGATPRWLGYVGVDDIDAIAGCVKEFGGRVFVPPTGTNIGRIAVVADPQGASFALVKELKVGRQKPAERGKPGQVGWRELLAADWQKAFAFYRALFGWQNAAGEIDLADEYQLFSTDGERIGGVFTKPPFMPDPFWVYYFNVGDIDAAAERVKAGGGRIFVGPLELPDGGWIVRCTDPQGAVFALQGKRDRRSSERASEVAWSTEWGEFSSKGRLVKPRS